MIDKKIKYKLYIENTETKEVSKSFEITNLTRKQLNVLILISRILKSTI